MPINKDYIASKIFQNKSMLENQQNIRSNLEQYANVNENVLLNVHALMQEAIKNNIFRIKKNGKIETIGERRERKKAQMRATPKAIMLLLPVVGFIIYGAMYWRRQRKFQAVKDEEKRQLREALINALETNPVFLETAKKYIDNLTDPRDKKIYQECLDVAQRHLNEVSEGKYDSVIDETIDYLQTQNVVNMDKQLLKEMYKNNTPEQLQNKTQSLSSTQKMSFSLDPQLDNSKLFKKMKDAKNKGWSLGGKDK